MFGVCCKHTAGKQEIILEILVLSYSSADQVTVHFINRDGERLTATAKEGQSLLEVVVNQNLAIDGFGRCCTRVGGVCAL